MNLTTAEVKKLVARRPSLAADNPELLPAAADETMLPIVERDLDCWSYVETGTVLLSCGNKLQGSRFFVLPETDPDYKAYLLDTKKWAANEVSHAEAFRTKQPITEPTQRKGE